MTLRDLKCFVAIAQEKSITRAAAQLFVAQPALNQCIQKLEWETGIDLFVRSNRLPICHGDCTAGIGGLAGTGRLRQRCGAICIDASDG